MVRYNDSIYYTCTEIANAFDRNNPDFKELKLKFCDVYDKAYDSDLYCSYIQNKLYSASKKKLIRYVEYQKKTNDRKYRAFSIPDIMDFLSRPEAMKIEGQTENIKNIQLVEVGENQKLKEKIKELEK